MSGVSQLEDYLDQLRAGARPDSSGEFTMDIGRQARRLGELSRAYPHRWLLFACQAAVAAGASKISVSSGLRADSVAFDLVDDPLARFPPTFLQGGSTSQEAGLLRAAFEWALSLGVECSLLVEGSEEAYVVRSDHQGTQRWWCPATGRRRVTLVAGRPSQPWWRRLLGRVEHSASLLVECRWRLACCPVPVTLDGFSLVSGRIDWLPGFRPPLTMLQIHLAPPGGPVGLALEHPSLRPSIRYAVGGACPQEAPPRPSSVPPLAEFGWLEVVPPQGERLELVANSGECDSQAWILGSWVHLNKLRQVAIRGGQSPDLQGFSGRRLGAQGAAFYHGRCDDRFFPVHFGMTANPIELSELGTEAWSVLWADTEFEFDASGLELVRTPRVLGQLEHCQNQIRQTQLRVARRWRAPRPG